MAQTSPGCSVPLIAELLQPALQAIADGSTKGRVADAVCSILSIDLGDPARREILEVRLERTLSILDKEFVNTEGVTAEGRTALTKRMPGLADLLRALLQVLGGGSRDHHEASRAAATALCKGTDDDYTRLVTIAVSLAGAYVVRAGLVERAEDNWILTADGAARLLDETPLDRFALAKYPSFEAFYGSGPITSRRRNKPPGLGRPLESPPTKPVPVAPVHVTGNPVSSAPELASSGDFRRTQEPPPRPASRVSTEDGDYALRIRSAIEVAERRVWLKVPWWHGNEVGAPRELLTDVGRARARGCDVRVIMRNDASNRAAITALERSSVEVRYARYLHEKELLCDGQLIVMSANFTSAELVRNVNSAYGVDAEANIEAAEVAFERLWGLEEAEALAGDSVWTRADTILPPQLAPYLADRAMFNPLQSAAVPVILHGRQHVLVVAPTGAGKTDLGEVAVLRSILLDGKRAVFLSPSRALSSELEARFKRWQAMGLRIELLTGEADIATSRVKAAQLWVATFEKFEALSRSGAFAQAVADVGCIVVDEIHLVGEPGRGPYLEAMLARIRSASARTRLVGLSATVSNADEIADWLHAQCIRSSWRPVQLTVQVLSYPDGPSPSETERNKDEITQKIISDIVAAPDPGQVIVFCGAKWKARRLAGVLAGFEVKRDDDDADIASRCLSAGVGLHYRGIPDLRIIESKFRSGTLRILVATSGLAAGVNLPARAVIIRDDRLGVTPLDTGNALQMLGRAGRAGLETAGFGFFLAPAKSQGEWRARLSEGHQVRSRLADGVDDHLLAEVLLGGITDVAQALSWYRETLAHHQGDDGNAPLEDAVALLAGNGFIEQDEAGHLRVTELGALTSRFLVDVRSAIAINEQVGRIQHLGVDRAESVVLSSVVSSVKTFADAFSNPSATHQASAYVATVSDLKFEGPSTGGAWKSLLAACVALERPTALFSSGSLGGYQVSELRQLAAELPRYLTWMSGLGVIGVLQWPAVVAGDLAARIQYWRLSPQRGDGRLLRWLARHFEDDGTGSALRGPFRAAIDRGEFTPPIAEPRPGDQTQPRRDVVRLDGMTLDANDDELRIRFAAGSMAQLLLVRANAGGSPSFAVCQRWGGADVVLPPPVGVWAGTVAIDALAFGAIDWAYRSQLFANVGLPTDEYASVRQLIASMPLSAGQHARRGWRHLLGSELSHEARELETLLADPTSELAEVAHMVVGHETGYAEQYSELHRGLDALLHVRDQTTRRTPSQVLASGEGSTSDRALVMATLLSRLGWSTGIAKRGTSGDLVAVLFTPEASYVLASRNTLLQEQLVPLVPYRRLVGGNKSLEVQPRRDPPVVRLELAGLGRFWSRAGASTGGNEQV